MPPRDWTLRLQDILLAIERIDQFTHSMDFAAFAGDPKTVDAVIRNFIVIGEAVRHLPQQILDGHDAVPWREISDMRNFIVHSYHQVDLQIVWNTIQQDLPELVGPLTDILRGNDGN